MRELFPNGKFPEGEWQSYNDDQRWRETDAEKREKMRLEEDMLNDVSRSNVMHCRLSMSYPALPSASDDDDEDGRNYGRGHMVPVMVMVMVMGVGVVMAMVMVVVMVVVTWSWEWR